MYRRIFPLFGLIAALAASSFGQNSYQFTASLAGDPALDRPRLVTESPATVNASVVAKMRAVERAAFDAINRTRIEHGLQALVWSDELAQIARLHSRNMAEKHFFAHRDTNNKMVNDRADDAGLKSWHAIGENIAFNRGFKDPTEKAVELWLDSSLHRQNLLNPSWRETAVGVAIGPDGSYYFTQVFIL